MKRTVFLSIIVALALSLLLLPAALGAESESDFEIVGGVLIKYNGPGGDVVIPDGVTRIDTYAFYNCDDLTSVVIPEGVIKLNTYAFYNCDNLESVTLPASLTSFTDAFDLFSHCYKLTSINVAEENPSYCSQDGALFSKDLTQLLRCPGGKSGTYVIPDTVTQVGKGAFYECRELTKIVVPEGVTELAEDMFGYCRSLTDVNIPDGVTVIGEDAFRGCSSLTSITLPEGVTTIQAGTFLGCSGLTELSIPDYVTAIEYGAFSGCSGLTSMVVPETVQTLGNGVFRGCTNLSDVTLPSHLTTIGEEMFYGCKSLKSMSLPAGVTSIGESAFFGCKSLENMSLPAGVTSIGKSAFSTSGLTTITLPQGVRSIEDRTFAWTPLTSIVLPEGVTKVGEDAFRNCEQLTSVHLPSSLMTLGHGAFTYCESLGRVDLPQGATNLGTYLFFGCDTLTDVTLPASLTAIPEAMFESTGLTRFTIPNTVKSIGNRAFQNCHSLEEVAIPGTVTTIGSSAFSGCDALREIALPQGLTYIPTDLVEGCTALERVSIPDSVTEIGWSAFAGCTALTTVELPGNLTYVNGIAFQGCSGLTGFTVAEGTSKYISVDGVLYTADKAGLVCYPAGKGGVCAIPEGVERVWQNALDANLTSVTLPDSVTELDPEVFYYCAGLTDISVSESHPAYTSVDGVLFSKDMSTLVCYPQGRAGAYTVPDSVTSIAASAFARCVGLTEITLPDTVNGIGEGAFRGCSGLSRVELPSGLTTIEMNTFADCTGLVELPIPDSVTAIRGGAFSGCSGLNEMVIPDSVTTLEYFAFNECTNLKRVTFGSGVTRIEMAMFQLCPNLTEVTFRGDVTDIARAAFSQCGLKDVYYGGSEQDWARVRIDSSESNWVLLNHATIHYNCTWPGVLTKSLFAVDTTAAEYTGDPITKSITSDLVEGTDYTVSYADNVEVGTAAITITGQGAYHGAVRYTFRIAPVGGDPVALPWQAFEVDTQDEVYTGSPITKTITTGLVEGVDYTVSYTDNVEVGTATLVIRGMGGYTGGWRYQFRIVEPPVPDPIALRGDMFSVDTAQETYTGSPITKVIAGQDGEKALVEGVDYTVDYADNTAAGTASITITGQGAYTGKLQYTFLIVEETPLPPQPITLTQFMFTVDTAPATYTGWAINKVIASELVRGTDYTVTYENNVNAGTATVVITGRGSYTGTLRYSFIIARASLTRDVFRVDTDPETYTGDPITKTVASVLTQGSDYTVAFSDNVEVGTATITLTGWGNYAGTLRYTFQIQEKSKTPITRSMFQVDLAQERYTGEPITKAIVSELVQGRDYSVAYEDNRSVGTATITITGTGDYKGTLIYTFQILEQEPPGPQLTCLTRNMFVVNIDQEVYTGKGITKEISSSLKENGYSVTYENNVNAGTAIITITGKGEFTGSLTYTFPIVDRRAGAKQPIPITRDMFEVDTSSEDYTGEAITKEVASELVRDVDYRVVFENNVSFGVATIQIIGMGDYMGVLEYRFQIFYYLATPVYAEELRREWFFAECVEFSEQYYTGEPIRPVVVAKKDGMYKETDYAVSYADHVEIGTATITVTGRGKYFGSLEYNFEIVERPTPPPPPVQLTRGMFSVDTSDEYYIRYVAITKEITSELTEGVDYKVEYANNAWIGTARITITGMGDYTGELEYTFQIVKKPEEEVPKLIPVSWLMFQLDLSDEDYTGQLITKEIATNLILGTDYTVDYKNNREVGTATITITGMGAYTGTLNATFNICGKFPAGSGQLVGQDRSLVWSSTTAGEVIVAGELAADEAVLVACYDEQGRLAGVKRITVDKRTVQVDVSSARVTLFWLDGRQKPMSPSATLKGE